MQLVVPALTFMVFAANPALATPGSLAHSANSTHSAHSGMQVAQSSHVEQICVDAIRSSGYRVNNILSTNSFSGGAEVIMEVQERGESLVVGCDYSENTRRIELYQLDDNGYTSRDDRYNDQYSDRYGNCSGNRYDSCNGDRYDNQYDDQYDDRYDDQYDDRHDGQYDSQYDTRYDSRYDHQYDDRYNSSWDDDRYNQQYDERYDSRHDSWQEQFYTPSGVRSEGDAEEIARGVVGDQLGIRDPYSEIVRIDDVQPREQDWIVEGRANGAPFIVKIRSSDAYILDFELH